MILTLTPKSNYWEIDLGESKINVSEKGINFTKGLQSKNILATAKHFPGHGDTFKDSHLTLPTISFDKKRINEVELYPFKKLIENGLSSVMIAHLNVPSLEKEKMLQHCKKTSLRIY